MRKVEIEMLKAIHEGRDWQSGNTAVEVSQHIGNPFCYATVYLHGNQIAEIYQTEATGEALIVAAELKTWRRWPTVTTASRLKALGIDCKTGNSPWCDDSINEIKGEG